MILPPNNARQNGLAMQVAMIVGQTHATVRHATLEAKKMLVAQPLMADGKSPDGPPLIAVDKTGAGVGDKVILTSDGAAIRSLFNVEDSPIRWAILGIVD